MQAIEDPASVLERFRYTCARAETIRAQATEKRAYVRDYRKVIAERRYQTIRAIWRSRQLRYDRHGRIVMEQSTGQPSGGDDEIGLDEVIYRLFRVSLALSVALESVAGPASDRVRSASDEMDDLIRDIRRSVFSGYQSSSSGLADYSLWLQRMHAAMADIDGLLESNLQSASPDLKEASAAAHRAITALDSGSEA